MSQCYVCFSDVYSPGVGNIPLCKRCGPKDPPKPVSPVVQKLEKEFGKGSVLAQKNGRPVDPDWPTLRDLDEIIHAESDDDLVNHCGTNRRPGVDTGSWGECTCAECARVAIKWSNNKYIPRILYWPDTGYPVNKEQLKEWCAANPKL